MSLLLIYQFDFLAVTQVEDLVVSWRFAIGSGADANKPYFKKLLLTHCYLIVSFQWLQASFHTYKSVKTLPR